MLTRIGGQCQLLTNNFRMVTLNQLLDTAGGFESPFRKGAEAMHRKVRGFFYAPHIMVGGVWEAARLAGAFSRSLNPHVIRHPGFESSGRRFLTTEKEQAHG